MILAQAAWPSSASRSTRCTAPLPRAAFADLWRKVPRGLTRWRRRFPARIEPDTVAQRAEDEALMATGWPPASPLRGARPPARHTGARHRKPRCRPTWSPSRPQRQDAAGLFAGFCRRGGAGGGRAVEARLGPLPQDGRYRVLVTSRRGCYGAAAAGWPRPAPRALEPVPRARHRWAPQCWRMAARRGWRRCVPGWRAAHRPTASRLKVCSEDATAGPSAGPLPQSRPSLHASDPLGDRPTYPSGEGLH